MLSTYNNYFANLLLLKHNLSWSTKKKKNWGGTDSKKIQHNNPQTFYSLPLQKSAGSHQSQSTRRTNRQKSLALPRGQTAACANVIALKGPPSCWTLKVETGNRRVLPRRLVLLLLFVGNRQTAGLSRLFLRFTED